MTPLILGILIGVLATIVFFRALSRLGPKSDKIQRTWFYSPRLLITVAAMVLYTFLFTRLGFFTSTFFLLIVLYHEKDHRGLWAPLIKSALTVTGGYILFHMLLKIQFPTGPWGIL
jgi:hypothetical protein